MTDRSQYFADCASPQPIDTINVDEYAAAGHKWISIKATEGVGYTYFDGNQLHKAAHAAGLKVFRYHWLRPDSNATAQAEYFAHVVESLLSADDRLMTDFEWPYDGVYDGTPAFRAGQLAQFTGRVHQLLPTHAQCVYTSAAYCQGPMFDAAAKFPIIQAAYTTTRPATPANWDVNAWQFSSSYSVPGFHAGGLDYNRILDRSWFATGTGKDHNVSENVTREEAINLIIQAMRTLNDGEKHGPFGPGNKVWAGDIEGLSKRLRVVEKKATARK
jgi:GH25 family lysozyme M1 (1,4-beta-N-acetylmuramidase)